jgi:hypothetical protein
MQTSDLPGTFRRSSRVPMALPVTIISLEPKAQFLETCETLVVSAHGCAMLSPIRLEAGVPLQFRSNNGRQTTGHVVDCQPIGSDQPGWKVAVKLDLPGNFWGLSACPDDWMRPGDLAGEASSASGIAGSMPKMPMLRALIAEQIEPLQAELVELTQQLTAQKKRNRFEVSLSHIPPEVEEKLWLRLREDLGTQALRQTREQTEKVLAAAQSAIELKITEAQEEFRNWVGEQLQIIEQRLRGISEKTGDELRQHVQSASNEFQQKASTAGLHLQQQSEQFLQSLLAHVGQEREAYRRELEAIQVASGAESSRLQTQLTELGNRVAELDETARNLESGLNTRLSRMAGEIVSGARTQMESAGDSLFERLVARNSKNLDQQLEEANQRLKGIQSEMEASAAGSVKAHVAEILRGFQSTMDDSAHRSMGRWRHALARDLDSITKILGGDFRAADGNGDERA